MDNSTYSKTVVDQLVASVKSQEANDIVKFANEINKYFKSIKVSDEKEILFNSDIKTESMNEFNLDMMRTIVILILNEANKLILIEDDKIDTKPDAVEVYVDDFNTVAEAAKFQAGITPDLVFSNFRLMPGVFIFFYASSVSLRFESSVSSEILSSTALYYKLIQSIDDVKNQTAIDARAIDTATLAKVKSLQISLIYAYAKDEITYDEWKAKDESYTTVISAIEARLLKERSDDKLKRINAKRVSAEQLKFAQDALEMIKGDSTENKDAVATTLDRVNNNYF